MRACVYVNMCHCECALFYHTIEIFILSYGNNLDREYYCGSPFTCTFSVVYSSIETKKKLFSKEFLSKV